MHTVRDRGFLTAGAWDTIYGGQEFLSSTGCLSLNVNLINALFAAFLLAQQVYLPPETLPRFNKEVAQFFFRKTRQDKGDERLQIFCLEKAIQFVMDKNHL